MRKIQIILLVLIIIGLGLIFTQKYWVEPLVNFILKQDPQSVPDVATVFCAESQRGADFCTADYAPVCATVEIQCIKAPCNPIQQTFSNSCEACKNSLAKSYIPGECR